MLIVPALFWLFGGLLTYMYRNKYKTQRLEQRPAISTISSWTIVTSAVTFLEYKHSVNKKT